MAEIPCLPLRKVTDGPVFGQPPGTLSTLQNMTLTSDGYAEARGGFEQIKPSGGSGPSAIGTGGYTGIVDLCTSYGWVRTFNSGAAVGSRWSGNTQFHRGGYKAFPGDIVDDAIYFGCDFTFTRISISLAIAANYTNPVYAYEFWNGSVWTALTTSETIDWTILRTVQYASWNLPTTWLPTDRGETATGNVYKYWMRIRLSAIAAVVTPPLVGFARGYWSGMRELYITSQSPRAGALVGTFQRYGQSGTVCEWFQISLTVSAMPYSPVRTAQYNGRVFYVTGKEQKRWDGSNYRDIGITDYASTNNIARAAGAGIGIGIWRYYGAWGMGPCRNTAPYVVPQVVDPLYGVGRAGLMVPTGGADPADANSMQTIAGNEQVIVTNPAAPAGVSALYIYRTQDLTNVPIKDRSTFPAFLIHSLRIGSDVAAAFEAGLTDTSAATVFPQTEAATYDVSPPSPCKFIGVYQNRLFLGDEETWYWSDVFTPDVFSGKSTTNFIRLARAKGGRHMGGIEFADQFVMWTEDQTWGVTNVDLDVPQLYPISLGVGCVGPEAIASGDGWLAWPATDGIYAWDGSRTGPVKISDDFDTTFYKMTYDSHGGSRATIFDHKYFIRLASPDGTALGSVAYVYDLQVKKWSTLAPTSFTSNIFPLTTIHAPFGNNDAGGLHSLWGKVDQLTTAVDYDLYLGDLTTQDDGNNFTCSATMHFPLPPSKMIKPKRVLAYYSAPDGWGTPSMSFATANMIGSSPGTLNAGVPDTGTDYSLLGGTFSGVSAGTSDVQVTFTVNSAAGGTVHLQRFYGAVLEGEPAGVRRGAV